MQWNPGNVLYPGIAPGRPSPRATGPRAGSTWSGLVQPCPKPRALIRKLFFAGQKVITGRSNRWSLYTFLCVSAYQMDGVNVVIIIFNLISYVVYMQSGKVEFLFEIWTAVRNICNDSQLNTL